MNTFKVTDLFFIFVIIPFIVCQKTKTGKTIIFQYEYLFPFVCLF